MLRSTSDTQHPRKWAEALRREMQMAIGRRLRDEYELPAGTAARTVRALDAQGSRTRSLRGHRRHVLTGAAGNRAECKKQATAKSTGLFSVGLSASASRAQAA